MICMRASSRNTSNHSARARRVGAWILGAAGVLVGSTGPASAATVIVDTGHTPTRTGSVSAGGRAEYDFNRRLAYFVAWHLQSRGVHVVRVEGEYPLTARTSTSKGADLFLSLHHDSIQQSWIDAGKRGDYAGYSVFVSHKNPMFQQSLWCGQNVGWALARAKERPSLYHATPEKGENRRLLDKSAGVHLYNDLVVLKTAQAPAILVEAGVIANPAEDLRLGDPRVANHLAGAIAQGVVACLTPDPPVSEHTREPWGEEGD